MEITAVAPINLRVNDMIENKDLGCLALVTDVTPLPVEPLVIVSLRNEDGSDSSVMLRKNGSISVFG